MTPATPKQPHPLTTSVLTLIFLWLVLTLLIWVGWNSGLESAGIVDNDINFGTSIGLGAVALVARSILAASGKESSK